MLTVFYGAMGNPPEAEGSIAMMAQAISAETTTQELNHALNRCMRECTFPVRLPDIFRRLPGKEVPQLEAEMRSAWDTVVKYVGRWGRWNSERDHAYIDQSAPALPQRVTDSVRRSGGWTALLAMGPKDFPFVQKRFFDEYQAWAAVEAVPTFNHLLGEVTVKRLIGQTSPVKKPDNVSNVSTVDTDQPAKKDFYQLPTPDQLRDRAAVQKAHCASWLAERIAEGKCRQCPKCQGQGTLEWKCGEWICSCGWSGTVAALQIVAIPPGVPQQIASDLGSSPGGRNGTASQKPDNHFSV